MTISDKIVELKQHREAIREAINGKGVDLAEGSHMSDYAGAINQISSVEVDYSIFKGYTILTPEMVSGEIGTYGQKYIGTATHLIIDDSFPTNSLNNLFSGNETIISLVILTDKLTNLANLFDSSSTQLRNIFINTSNVTNMNSILFNSQTTSLDVSSFDTSNVTDMGDMFSNSQVNSLDLSSFDTSKVTNMSGMFSYSKLTEINLLSFDTSKVINMSGMFRDAIAEILDLSSFDTSNVTTMFNMFAESQATTLDLSSFDTSNVTDMRGMFASTKLTTLDLSSFDTSNMTDIFQMAYMFNGCTATTGYARTQADADKFNESPGKPEGLVFVVKP